jgi:hypothetical protein
MFKCPREPSKNHVKVVGLISKFSLGCGKTGTDRQFFFVNGRPCNPSKVCTLHVKQTFPTPFMFQMQKAFNEIYRSFNVNQSPFIIADFILPTRKLPNLLNLHNSLTCTVQIHATSTLVLTNGRSCCIVKEISYKH